MNRKSRQELQAERYRALRGAKKPTHSRGYSPKKKMEFSNAPTAPTVTTTTPPLLEQVKTAVQERLSGMDVRLTNTRRSYLLLSSIPVFMAGVLFGLVVLGWYVFPVEWTDAPMSALREQDQALFIELAADMYSIDHNTDRAKHVMSWDTDGTAVCAALGSATDPAQVKRMAYLAMAVRGIPCNDTGNQ